MEYEPHISKEDDGQLLEILSTMETAMLFRDFLRTQSASMFLSFWYEVEDFKSTLDADTMLRKAQSIILKYLVPEGECDISLDGNERNRILEDVKRIMSGEEEDVLSMLSCLLDNPQKVFFFLFCSLFFFFFDLKEDSLKIRTPLIFLFFSLKSFLTFGNQIYLLNLLSRNDNL